MSNVIERKIREMRW